MTKLNLFTFLSLSIFLLNLTCQAQCNMDDWTALKALYESTDGDNWTNRIGWDVQIDNLSNPPTSCNLEDLHGITLDGDGRIRDLRLFTNNLIGSLPIELGNLVNLEDIWLFGNQLNGNIPSELGSLVNLREINLYDNKLTGSIPTELGNLTNLTKLNLNRNELNGSIPPELGNLTNLTEIYLYKNNLVGNIPAELGNLTMLTKLYLYENLLTGNIPAQLGNLNNLTGLILSRNELDGTIPHQLGSLTNLTLLQFYENQLTGNIPAELGNLNNLTQLYLYDNLLNGNLPSTLGNMANLEHLYLYNNQLGGDIPTTLGNLTNLTHLFLNNNQLSGNIPVELNNLTNLTWFEINDNNLSGCYDINLVNFCTQLSHSFDNGDADISNGNNFDAPWDNFCATAEGSCTDSQTNIVSIPTNYSGNVSITGTLNNNNQHVLQNNHTQVINHSTCNSNNNTNCDAIVGFNNYAANEVLWATEKAYDYFLEEHNYNLTTVNNYVNSSYIDYPNHAVYNSSDNAVYYGAGDGILRTSMTSPDIVGHEITHHLINSISQLSNYGESGALQESFADIFGEMIEHYCYGSNDWIFGSQVITPNADHIGIRNLANPSDANMKNPQPAFYQSDDYWIVQNEACYFDDLCGIHINNGVQNYWFYLLSEGGSGINENGDAYNIIGIGKENAARIAFENLKNISTNTEAITPYYQAMYGAIQAAQTLFGENSDEVTQTRNAWRAVGLYETQTNPIKWQIANEQRDHNRPIVENGNTTIIPMFFDLVIDSLDQDLTADKLTINLQLPNQLVIDNVTALAPLLQSELAVEQGTGEANVAINRQSNQSAKMQMAPRIQSGSSILRVGVCIITENISGEDLNLKITISGGTESGTFIQFETDELPIGSENNDFNSDTNYLLNIALGLNQKSCSALGWLDVDVLNGDSPYKYTLKNSLDITIEEVIKNEFQHQFYNLIEDDYELNISEEDGQRTIVKNFTISHYANTNGSECCPENLIMPAGQFSGIFRANQQVKIKQGFTFNLGKISICNE